MLYSAVRMHIPDGFLSLGVAGVCWVLALGGVGYALRRVDRELGERQVPLMGVLAAGIFAGQMLNFSVTGGTSGHLMGAALATILLGPWAAVVVMTCVVGIQALVFQDGGLLVLGANLFNMALVGTLVAHFVDRVAAALLKRYPWGLWARGFAAGWFSLLAAALACALQLAFSGTSPLGLALPAMLGIHTLIGIGEGAITAGALAFVFSVRPAAIGPADSGSRRKGRTWVIGGLIALGLVALSPLASAHPDGLEWVAERQGFLEAARAPLYALIPDYLLPGISNGALATILAGAIGVLIVMVAVWGVARMRRRREVC